MSNVQVLRQTVQNADLYYILINLCANQIAQMERIKTTIRMYVVSVLLHANNA